ncbi:MAG: hypothetical protein IH808_09325 [Proteobacteria bacterium]|nr:hypothetical protein [Pseudomonadota bacterium]
MVGADYDSFFYDGTCLTIIGQSTFIAAYAMPVFISRLRRVDPALDRNIFDPGNLEGQVDSSEQP